MNRDVFISYSRRNFNAVMEIKNQIDRTCGTECWIDLKGIESGSEMFLRDIVGGIDACKVFLFMLSRESMESEYALLELNYAKEQGKRVVLVNIDDCRMNGVFLFKYSLTDTIAWNNPPQREKLLRDVARWVGSGQSVEKKPTQLSDIEKRIASLNKKIGKLTFFKDSNCKYGFMDKRGCIVIPCLWNDIRDFSEGLACIQDSKNKWGYIDKSGRIVIPCQWDFAWSFRENLARVKDNSGKFGFIDKSGRIVIPCQWKKTFEFREGLARVQDSNNKWGYIDKTGRVVIPCQWNYVWSFHDGLAAVKDNKGRWGYVNKNNNVVIPCQWSFARSFNEGLARVQDGNRRCGFIDKRGRIAIPCKWSWAGTFYGGYSNVMDNNGNRGYINRTGRVVLWGTE